MCGARETLKPQPPIPLPPSGLCDLIEPDVMYVSEVLLQSGPDLARVSYWDVGEHSDLWREYRHVPEGTTFEVGTRGRGACYCRWVGEGGGQAAAAGAGAEAHATADG